MTMQVVLSAVLTASLILCHASVYADVIVEGSRKKIFTSTHISDKRLSEVGFWERSYKVMPSASDGSEGPFYGNRLYAWYQTKQHTDLEEFVFVQFVKVHADKRTRLALTSTLIKNGTILFPDKGCEELIEQLVGFGVEKHDDLADAFSLLIHKTVEMHKSEGTIIMFFLCGDHDSTIYHSTYHDVLKDHPDCLIQELPSRDK